MATENLQIPDIAASQNQKEVTANAAHNLLDRAINNNVQKTITGDTTFTTTETRENFVIELIGTPGAPHTIDMPDTNNRTLAVVNNTDDVMTIRNSASGGSGQPSIAVGEASIFHYDGTDFFDLSALALTVASWLGLTDTPAAYTGESGRYPQVNDAEAALEFVGTAAKRNVIAATTGAITLADDIETGDTLDGVTLAEFDRVLVKDQGSGEENGIYYVQTAAPPIRVEDFDDALDMEESPVLIPVLEGTSNAGTVWLHTTTGAITVDTTTLTFVNLLSTGTFLALTDTPSSYSGQAGKSQVVNSGETALEFVDTVDFTKASVQTTDATVTAIATVPIADTTTLRVHVRGGGREDATGDYYTIEGHWVVDRQSGTVTAQAGSLDVIDTAGGSTWTIVGTANDTAKTLDFDVTGEAAHTIEWDIDIFVTTIT